MSIERDELAEIIQDVGEYIPGSHADDYVSPNKAADAILAAGYRKTEPLWADTLTNDGKYEYTVSSDCDGSNVQYWRRVPGKTYIEAAAPWEAYEPTEPAA